MGCQKKMTLVEYAVTLLTFIFIQIMGVEYGILAGFALYMVFRWLGMDLGAVDAAASCALNFAEPSETPNEKENLCSVAGVASYSGIAKDCENGSHENQNML